MTDFRALLDLAAERLGGTVLFASDDFFADKENLLRAAAPEWREHAYTDRGKWMDGWESRRKRAIGDHLHDTAIVRLGLPGVVRGVVVDTSFFRGNFPESCALEACAARSDTPLDALMSDATSWVPLVVRSKLEGNAENAFEVTASLAATHVRLRIFPDGGVARLRVYGEPAPEWRRLGGATKELDLAALECGAQVLSCSDMFFGPKDNLISPGRAANMSDGWETKRRRGVTAETHDWVTLKLAGEGTLARVEIDTSHFHGNFPDTCMLEGAATESGPWQTILPRTKLMAHTRHFFVEELEARGPFSHVRLKVFPDGGVSRLRIHGTLTEAALGDAVARHLAGLSERALTEQLKACCASRAWVLAIARSRPFSSGAELFAKVDEAWNGLGKEAWLEAFAAHPRIGEARAPVTREARWSSSEQLGMRKASSQTLSAMTIANAAYEEKFGYVFLVHATGKTAPELLHAARTRMSNPPEVEIGVAAEELRKIVHLRLRKLIGA